MKKSAHVQVIDSNISLKQKLISKCDQSLKACDKHMNHLFLLLSRLGPHRGQHNADHMEQKQSLDLDYRAFEQMHQNSAYQDSGMYKNAGNAKNHTELFSPQYQEKYAHFQTLYNHRLALVDAKKELQENPSDTELQRHMHLVHRSSSDIGQITGSPVLAVSAAVLGRSIQTAIHENPVRQQTSVPVLEGVNGSEGKIMLAAQQSHFRSGR